MNAAGLVLFLLAGLSAMVAACDPAKNNHRAEIVVWVMLVLGAVGFAVAVLA